MPTVVITFCGQTAGSAGARPPSRFGKHLAAAARPAYEELRDASTFRGARRRAARESPHLLRPRYGGVAEVVSIAVTSPKTPRGEESLGG